MWGRSKDREDEQDMRDRQMFYSDVAIAAAVARGCVPKKTLEFGFVPVADITAFDDFFAPSAAA